MTPGDRIRFDHGAFGDKAFHLTAISDAEATVISPGNVTFIFERALFNYLKPYVVTVVKKKRAKDRAKGVQ